ncbi:sigma factor-like helix-turn-helix DNA-binding protein [Streptomyces cinnamoneus]|uniref:sigma factor-like helix-turn-helix DNA-binding protein n=1 Tax=Streptomyces cinnamoneus TaxID=53446 RepID=UPI0033C1BBB6
MSEHANDQQSRGGNGRFTRSIDTAEQDARAARLRSGGMPYRDIAAELGIDVSTAHRAVERALRAIVEEPAQDVRRLVLGRIDAALTRFDDMETRVRDVLQQEHVVVSNGRVVLLDGQPIPDPDPILKAIDRLVRIEEGRQKADAERRKLLGLDAPARIEAAVHEVTQQDLELQEMVNALKARNAAAEEQLRAGDSSD